MSLHRSLKTKSGALEAHRNVLTRPERIAKLSEGGRFEEHRNNPLGLAKVRSIKVSAGKKKKEEKEEGEAAAAGAAPAAAPVSTSAAAPAAKGAAPATKGGAKAPAGKK